MFKTGALDSVAGAYVDEDIPSVTPGTRIEADDRNIIQDEIVNAIEGSGQTLDASGVFTNNDQLFKAFGGVYNLQVFTSSGSYSKPTVAPFVKSIKVTIVGGGGGGGGMDGQSAGTFAAGKPGGGGGASIKKILASALSASEAVTIGAGGAGGAAGVFSGSSGGTTLFGAHCSATGGVGGPGELGSTNVEAYEGIEAGMGSAGDINIPGGPGGISVSLNSDSRGAISGNGGSSLLSGGAKSENDQNGDGATGYGGGGAGGAGSNLATNYAGGDGSDGIVIVEEFF